MLSLLAIVPLLVWAYLLLGRGFFWRAEEAPPAPVPARWPEIVAVVPARDEAPTIGRTVASLLGQTYQGRLSVVVVDDHSRDGTAEIAREAARGLGAADRLEVLTGAALPPGWAGKVWAMDQGWRRALALHPGAELVLLTDADIEHHPTNLAELAARAEAERLDLASLMVRLNCESLAERALIPAFVFFFAMLYPFAWAADPRRRTAAAAGGCMLVRTAALERIGGFAALRGALIDDCALAATVKPGGRIWLGLSARTRSLRPYPHVGDIWRMVARTAYTQLSYSPLLLAGCVLGMGVTYLAPPLLVIAGGPAAGAGLAAWGMMSLAYLPMLRFYGVSPGWAPLLPLIALVYLGATLDSARRHWSGRGGEWKGRVQQLRGPA